MSEAKEYTIEQIADHILARGAIHPRKLMLFAWYIYSYSLLPEFQDHGIRITDGTFTASGHGPRHAGLAKRCLANDNILIAQNTAELKPDPELDSFLDMIDTPSKTWNTWPVMGCPGQGPTMAYPDTWTALSSSNLSGSWNSTKKSSARSVNLK